MGLQIQILNATTIGEIDAAFATLARERPDALFVAGNSFFSSRPGNLPLWRRATDTGGLFANRFCPSGLADELRN